MLPWTGYYINLDRSPGRRKSIERQLAAAGILSSYSRFEAIDGSRLVPVEGMTPSELGCFRSHSEVLRTARTTSKFVHVLEDDAILSTNFVGVLSHFIYSGALDEFDLVFTDVFPFDLSAQSLRKLKWAYDAAMSGGARRFSLIDLHGFAFGGANSYLVNANSLSKVLMGVNGSSLRNERPSAIDMLYLREINLHRLKAACVFPFISAVDLDLARASTIDDRSGLLSNILLRHAFYADCDIPTTRSYVAQLNVATADEHTTLLTDIHRLMLHEGKEQPAGAASRGTPAPKPGASQPGRPARTPR